MSLPPQISDLIKTLSPTWLSADIGGAYLKSWGQACDAIVERAKEAQKARMPLECDASALPLIGNDRLMTQGPGESTSGFRVRLQRAFETWQHAGEARAVLEQAATYVSGLTGASGQDPLALIVSGYRARKWSWFLAADDPTQEPNLFVSPVDNWSWDGLEAVRWWRAWLVLFAYRSPPTLSGTAASLASASGGFVTVTGLSGIPLDATSLTLPGYLTISGAATATNDATYQITQVLSSSSVVIAAPDATVPDANNGALAWDLSYYPGLQPAPVVGFPGATVPDEGTNTNQAVGVQLPGAPNSVDTSAFFAQLRALARLWKSAGTFYPWFVLSFGGDTQVPDAGGSGSVIASEFTPWTLSPSLGNPDGTWATWAKRSGGLDVVARVSGAPMGQFDEFIDGTGRIQDGFMVT